MQCWAPPQTDDGSSGSQMLLPPPLLDELEAAVLLLADELALLASPAHAPSSQVWPSSQASKQSPQCFSDVETSMQKPPQSCEGALQSSSLPLPLLELVPLGEPLGVEPPAAAVVGFPGGAPPPSPAFDETSSSMKPLPDVAQASGSVTNNHSQARMSHDSSAPRRR
jgi:hypothetical protein